MKKLSIKKIQYVIKINRFKKFLFKENFFSLKIFVLFLLLLNNSNLKFSIQIGIYNIIIISLSYFFIFLLKNFIKKENKIITYLIIISTVTNFLNMLSHIFGLYFYKLIDISYLIIFNYFFLFESNQRRKNIIFIGVKILVFFILLIFIRKILFLNFIKYISNYIFINLENISKYKSIDFFILGIIVFIQNIFIKKK